MQVAATLSDQDLILNYLDGNDKSFEILLTRHRQRIYTQIYLFVKDKALAEDIFQEVFIKIVDTIRKGKESIITKASSYSGLSVSHTTCVWTITVDRNVAQPYHQQRPSIYSMYCRSQMTMLKRR